MKESLKWLELVTTLIVTADLAQDERLALRLIISLVVIASIEALWGIVQVATGAGPEAFALGDALRAFGNFDQPNPFAGYLAMVLPLSVALTFARPLSPRVRQGFGLGALILAAGVFLSQSRGAWLGLVVVMLVLMGLWSHRTRLGLLLLAMGGAFVVLLAFAHLLPASMLSRLAQTFEYFGVFDVRTVELTPDNWAVVERMAHWQAGWWMFLDNPWFGVGAGNYAAEYVHYYVRDWLDPLGHAHNYYLNTMAELGLVGLTFLLVFLFVLGRRLISALVASDGADPIWRAILAGSVGALVLFCSHNMFDNLFVHSVNVQLGFLIALGVVAADRVRQARLTRRGSSVH